MAGIDLHDQADWVRKWEGAGQDYHRLDEKGEEDAGYGHESREKVHPHSMGGGCSLGPQQTDVLPRAIV